MTGFDTAEYKHRTERAQALMAAHELDALLLTTEPDVRYFTGFLTRFWESPTRPWFVIVPATGKPIVVIPAIGLALMQKTWVDDIRTWNAPDLEDDGIGLLADALCDCVPASGVIGLPDGHESHVRMPLADLERLKTLIEKRRLGGDRNTIRTLRMVKSDAEIAKITASCDIAGRAFARLPEIASEGVALDAVFRGFQILCLEEGADWVPYLAGGAGQGGYVDVISPATAQVLRKGDVLMLDTGLVRDGYFCDFDRNWSIGRASDNTRRAHACLIEATHAGLASARPGNTAADVFHAMAAVLMRESSLANVGRLGHGVGMSLTEWPSILPSDQTPLQRGMVLTLEPGIASDRGIMVHEENIVIRNDGAHFLSKVAAAEIIEL